MKFIYTKLPLIYIYIIYNTYAHTTRHQLVTSDRREAVLKLNWQRIDCKSTKTNTDSRLLIYFLFPFLLFFTRLIATSQFPN